MLQKLNRRIFSEEKKKIHRTGIRGSLKNYSLITKNKMNCQCEDEDMK